MRATAFPSLSLRSPSPSCLGQAALRARQLAEAVGDATVSDADLRPIFESDYRFFPDGRPGDGVDGVVYTRADFARDLSVTARSLRSRVALQSYAGVLDIIRSNRDQNPSMRSGGVYEITAAAALVRETEASGVLRPDLVVGTPFEVLVGGRVTARHTVWLAVEAPAALALEAPRPNPARGAVEVAATVPAAGPARLAVYDALGREVAVVVDGPVEAGAASWRVETAGWAAGTYLVRLTHPSGVAVRPVAVVR